MTVGVGENNASVATRERGVAGVRGALNVAGEAEAGGMARVGGAERAGALTRVRCCSRAERRACRSGEHDASAALSLAASDSTYNSASN
jgi:hypothetical protein